MADSSASLDEIREELSNQHQMLMVTSSVLNFLLWKLTTKGTVDRAEVVDALSEYAAVFKKNNDEQAVAWMDIFTRTLTGDEK